MPKRKHKTTSLSERKHKTTSLSEKKHKTNSLSEKKHKTTSLSERKYKTTSLSEKKHKTYNFPKKLDELETFIKKYGMTIEIIYDEDAHYDFKLILEGNEIALLSASITEANVRKLSTRSHSKLEEDSVINILWIGINEDYIEYQGKGLGSFLLLYSIIYLKKENPNIKWSVLDDDSERSKRTKNIYAKMHFEFVDLISLENETTVKISGPEKQLDIENDFMPIIDNLIKNVETKIDSTFRKKIGGNKKTLKNIKKRMKSIKKQKNHNKTKKNNN